MAVTRKEAEPVAPVAIAPEVFGYGLEDCGGGKFIACRIGTHGTKERIGPTANGTHRPESKSLALSRLMDAIRSAYVGRNAERLR